MKKKILAAVMAATMVFSLVACGSSDAGSSAATGSAATDTASAGATSTDASGDLIKVGIINNDPNESGYRTANDKDMKNTFTEANGYEASFAYSLKNDEQITAAQKFIQDGVDYLLLSAADTAGWDSVLKDAQDAGIRVILFDRTIDADESLYEASIVSDMAKEGQTAVDWLKSQNLSEYNIIHLQGVMGSAAQQGRTGALDDAAANDGFNLVTQQTAEWNAEKAQQIVQSVIDAGTPFNVIYAENDDMAKGAVAALDKANISHGVGKDVIVMGFDCNKWALEELKAGNWNYDGQCNPFQASYIDEIIKKLNSLVQYLITPNGAVSCDVTGTQHWYVRGNMNKTASENGPARGDMGKNYSDYPYQRGLQGNLILVISDAYYFKAAKLRSSGTLQDVPFANSNTLSPTRIDYSGDRDSLLNLYWYLDERLQEDDYVIANGCFREKDGNTTKTYGIDLTFENDGERFDKNGREFTNWSKLEKEIRLVENTTDQDILNRIESTVWLLHWPGRTKHIYTVTEGSYTSRLWYSENTSEKTEFEVVDKIEACMQFRQIRKYKTAILDVGLSIDKPLVEGDTSSGAFTVSDSNAGYTMVDTYGYWDEDDFPLKPGNNFPANLKWMYHRLLTLTAKTGYRFDKEELPRVTVTGLNRPCDSITVKYKDETTIQVYLDAYPSEVIQYAYGTVSGLKVGKKASQVKVKQDDTINATIYGKYEFTDVEVLK